MKQLPLLFLCIFLSSSLSAQKPISLEECIILARENSLLIKQAGLSTRQAELGLKQSKMSRLPNLNASVNNTYSFGRSIDPVSNDFVNKTIVSNGLSLSSGINLYSGGRVQNSIKQNQFSVQAAHLDAEQNMNDLALNVSQAFLSVLLAEEQLKTTEQMATQSNQQLEQTEKLISAGAMAPAARYELEAQIARNEQTIVAAQNAVDMAYLNLKLLIQIDPELAIKADAPNLFVPAANELKTLTAETVYKEALALMPNIQAIELRKAEAEAAVKVARSGYYPTLSAFVNLSTNYSNLAKKVNGFQTVESEIGDVVFNGDTLPLAVLNDVPILGNSPYFNQFGDNFGQAAGVSLSIPIFSNGQVRIAEERAQLNVLGVELSSQQLRQTLRSDVTRALADAKAAEKQYNANERALKAAKVAYENTNKRLELGAANTFELTISRSSYESAQINLLISKYDYLFKVKIIDFYRGTAISGRGSLK